MDRFRRNLIGFLLGFSLPFLFLVLSGCAQWQGMTPEQRNVVIGTAIASALVGYALNDDDDVTVIVPPRDYHCRNDKCR